MKNNVEKPKILLVDDRPENLFALGKILKQLDVTLVNANSGNDALTETLHHDFALILLDVQMPEMNGYEVAEYLREDENTKKIPIIFITAIDRDDKREMQGYSAGAVDYIFKPINPGILLSKVKVFIELYEKQRKLQRLVKNLEDSNRQLKQLQSQLIQSEKMSSIGQLAAGVAHEINNPIGFVGSNIHTLLEYIKDITGLLNEYDSALLFIKKLKDNEEADEICKRIIRLKEDIDLDFILEDVNKIIDESKEGCDRVKKIVSDLKDFSHIDQPEIKLFNINNGIESTLTIVWNEIKYKATVKKEYGDIPMIKCYPQQINQVFMNILVNAAQSIKEKGEIFIKTVLIKHADIEQKIKEGFTIVPVTASGNDYMADENFIEVSITDTGEGITKENISKIFDPFFTTKEVGKGTGLGLSVSFGIIKRHNGHIGVKSNLGSGTYFVIYLPVDGKLAASDEHVKI